MEKQPTRAAQTFLAIGAVTGWLALILQLYLIIINRTASITETITRYFSFYTILTNILVAICLTTLLIKPGSRLGNFFSRPDVVTAIALYITVVGIVYNLILRQQWNPEGLQRLADELLHVVTPLLFILYWFILARKVGLRWKNVFRWLLYPLLYVIVILFRGALSAFYPYPFIDVKILGYNKVLLNSGGLFIAFLVLSLLFVAIAKIIHRRPEGNT